MKVCTCFLLFRIFAYTNSTAQNSEYKSSVVPTLETDLESRNKDNSEDEKISDNEQNIKTNKTDNESDGDSRSQTVASFTDFIQEAINILNTYEDTAYEHFFEILDDEIRKYHYRGCKFYELTENYQTRRVLATKLDLIKGKSVSVMKANINALAHMIKDEIYDRNVKEFLDYINSLYRWDAEHKFHKVLNELESYKKLKAKRNNDNLVKIIRSGVRSIIFDHYSELNTNARRELKDRIQTFWQKFREASSSTANINVVTYTTSVSDSDINTVNSPENHSTEDIEHEQKEVQQQQTTTKNYSKASTFTIFIDKEIMRERKLSNLETVEEQNQDEVTIPEASEKDKTNIKTESQAIYCSSHEILSGESFDTSSNSIALSQNRQQEYEKQRYVTLYPEEMSYRSKTTKEPDISHKSANAMAEAPMVQMLWTEEATEGLPIAPLRPTTTARPTLRSKYESSTSDESKVWSKLRIKDEEKNDMRVQKLALEHDTDDETDGDTDNDTDDDTNQDVTDNSSDDTNSDTNSDQYELKNKGTPAKSMSMDEKRNFYKHKRMFDPVEMNMKYGVAVHAKFVVPTDPVPVKTVIPPRAIRIRAEINHLKVTPSTKSTIKFSKRYFTRSKQYNKDARKSIAPPLRSNEGISIKPFKKDGNNIQKSLRKNKGNDTYTSDIETNNDYFNRKIKNLEKELNELKKITMFRSRVNDTSTDGDDVNNVNDEAIDKIEQDENKEKHTIENVNIKLVNDMHKNNKIGSRDNNGRYEFSLASKETTSYSSAAETTTNNTIKASTTIKSTRKPPKKSKSAKPVSLSPKPPEIIKKDEVYTTINDNKDKLDKKTSEITSEVSKTAGNATETYTEETNKAIVTNNATASTVSHDKVTRLQSVVTFPTVGKTKTTRLYSDPPNYGRFEFNPYGQFDQIDPFDHIQDGFNFGK